MVTQHAERGWNRTYVPTDINPFINYPPSPSERVCGKLKDLAETLLCIKGVKPQNKKTGQCKNLTSRPIRNVSGLSKWDQKFHRAMTAWVASRHMAYGNEVFPTQSQRVNLSCTLFQWLGECSLNTTILCRASYLATLDAVKPLSFSKRPQRSGKIKM